MHQLFSAVVADHCFSFGIIEEALPTLDFLLANKHMSPLQHPLNPTLALCSLRTNLAAPANRDRDIGEPSLWIIFTLPTRAALPNPTSRAVQN